MCHTMCSPQGTVEMVMPELKGYIKIMKGVSLLRRCMKKSQSFNITVQITSQDGNGNSRTATMCHKMCSFQETIEMVMLELKWWLKNEEGVSCFGHGKSQFFNITVKPEQYNSPTATMFHTMCSHKILLKR